MGHGGDRLGRAEFAAEATTLCPQITLAPEKGRGGEPEGGGRPIDHRPSASAQHLPASDAVIRTQAQPRRTMVLVGPARRVKADFADHGLCDADVDAVNPGQVDPADAVEFVTEIELGSMTASFSSPFRPCTPRIWGWRRGWFAVGGRAHLVGEACPSPIRDAQVAG